MQPTPDTIVAALLETDLAQSAEELVDGLPRYRVRYLEFTTGQGPCGSGGWSRNARHRPQPKVVTIDTNDVVFRGKSVIVNGVRRLKANVQELVSGQVLRRDYLDL